MIFLRAKTYGMFDTDDLQDLQIKYLFPVVELTRDCSVNWHRRETIFKQLMIALILTLHLFLRLRNLFSNLLMTIKSA